MIRNWLKEQNKKYDSVKEPNRIFIAMAVALPGIIISSSDTNLVAFAGMCYLITLLVLRALYIHGKL